MKRAFTALVIVGIMPSLAAAQRGGFGRGGRAPGIAREPGITIVKPVNMVNLLIEHRQAVALSDSQFKQVISLKRTLDSTNAPHMRRLDSLSRLFRGGAPIFSTPTRARRDSLVEARGVMRESIAIIDDNNASARDHAYALLDAQQLVKAQTIESDAEKALAQSESKSRKP